MMRFFSIYGSLVLFMTYAVFILSGNEGRTWWQDRRFFLSGPPLYQSILRQEVNDTSTSPKSMYRHDLQRTGYYDVALRPDLKMQTLKTIENLGIHSASKAGPVILDDQILIVTDSSQMVAYDEKIQPQWRFRNFTSPFGFHGTPAVHGKTVIGGDYSGLLFAADRKTGKLFWTLQLGDTFGAAPLITEDGNIIISAETDDTNGFIAKVRLKDGKIQWLSSWLGDQSHSSPALSTHEWGGSRVVVVGDNAGYVNGIRETDGTHMWRYAVGKPVKSTPAIFGDTAYVSAWDGQVHAIDIATGAAVWTKPLGAANQSSIALTPDGRYGFLNSTRGVCRFSLSSVQDLKCEEVEMSRGTRKASPSITRNANKPSEFLVWAACDKQAMCVFDAHTFKRLKKWPLPAPFSGEPVAHKGTISIMPEEKSGLITFK